MNDAIYKSVVRVDYQEKTAANKTNVEGLYFGIVILKETNMPLQRREICMFSMLLCGLSFCNAAGDVQRTPIRT